MRTGLFIYNVAGRHDGLFWRTSRFTGSKWLRLLIHQTTLLFQNSSAVTSLAAWGRNGQQEVKAASARSGSVEEAVDLKSSERILEHIMSAIGLGKDFHYEPVE